MPTPIFPRVVITGLGTINPLGTSLDEYYNNLIDGKSGIRFWESIDCSAIDCKVGGDLGNFDCKEHLFSMKDKVPEAQFIRMKKMFRSSAFSSRMTILSALKAFMDAVLIGADFDPFRTSVVVAGHNLNHRYILDNNLRYLQDPDSVDILSGVEGLDTNTAASVAEALQCRGATYTVGGACASGNIALRDGYRDIVIGGCERAVVAGAAFDISAPDIYSLTNINAVITDAELQKDPTRASRPFDAKRKGFVPSHGAGAIILERLESALERGVPIYGEVAGVLAYSDASRLPSPSSEGQARLIKDLLKISGVAPEEIDYVNCHATSTKLGDVEEIEAIKNAFGSHAYKLKLNATKSLVGHCTWSASTVEMIAAILQMKYGTLHPSLNIDELDPAIDLDVCANTAQKHEVRCFLKNSFGFGNINCSASIKKYE